MILHVWASSSAECFANIATFQRERNLFDKIYDYFTTDIVFIEFLSVDLQQLAIVIARLQK